VKTLRELGTQYAKTAPACLPESLQGGSRPGEEGREARAFGEQVLLAEVYWTCFATTSLRWLGGSASARS